MYCVNKMEWKRWFPHLNLYAETSFICVFIKHFYILHLKQWANIHSKISIIIFYVYRPRNRYDWLATLHFFGTFSDTVQYYMCAFSSVLFISRYVCNEQAQFDIIFSPLSISHKRIQRIILNKMSIESCDFCFI